MGRYVEFNKLELGDCLLKDCDIMFKDEFDTIRLYVNPVGDGLGFDANLLMIKRPLEFDNSVLLWEQDNSDVEVILSVEAWFDGIHDIKSTKDLSLVGTSDLSEVFKVLGECEGKYCDEWSNLSNL